MLNRREKRRLHEIERSLERDDPEFAQRIRSADMPDRPALARWATRAALGGAVLAVIGLALNSPLGGLGVLVAVIGLALRLAVPAFTTPSPSRPSPSRDDDDDDGEPGPGHDRTRI